MSQKRTNTIIELYGAPGVGKSTLAKRFADKGVTVILPNLKKHHYLWLPFFYPKTVFFWALLIFNNFLKNPNFSIFTYNFSLLFSSLQKLHDAMRSKATLVIIDEGLVQRFLSYSDVVHGKETILRLLKNSPHGDVLICVNDRIATSRRYDDSHIRVKQGESSLAKWKQNLESNLDSTRNVLSHNTLSKHSETKVISADDILKSIQT